MSENEKVVPAGRAVIIARDGIPVRDETGHGNFGLLPAPQSDETSSTTAIIPMATNETGIVVPTAMVETNVSLVMGNGILPSRPREVKSAYIQAITCLLPPSGRGRGIL